MLLLSLVPLLLPGLHLRLVVLLQGEVGCMADSQRLLQLSMLTGECFMVGTLLDDPPAQVLRHEVADAT